MDSSGSSQAGPAPGDLDPDLASPEPARRPEPARSAEPARGPVPLGRLPLRVRVMRRISGRGLPTPGCRVLVQPAIEVPGSGGVTLLADHYIPVTDEPVPTLLVRTPYGRGFPWDFLYGAHFAGQGFHVVIQSCRGTGGSGGAWEPGRHERADGLAAVAWLRGQDWFSGALATIGPSYLGFVQWALAAEPPPELRALVIQNGLYDMHGLLYPGGAFALESALAAAAATLSMQHGFASFAVAGMRLLRWHRRVERTLPLIDAYPPALGGRAAFFDHWLTQPDPGDPYWGAQDTGPAAGELAVPVSLMTGWDDICLDQTLELYRRLRGGRVRLLIGPWNHSSAFNDDLPTVFGDALGWLRAHLDDQPADAAAPGPPPPGPQSPGPPPVPQPPVRVHVGGCGEWRDLPDWPPAASARSWYLNAAGTLTADPPPRTSASSIRYDPAAPTPSAGGQTLNVRKAGAVRNDALESRADVLVFTSAPIAGPLEIIGPVSAQLQVSASSPYFDVFARLCDVDRRGRSRNVCDGLVRHQPASGPPAGSTVAGITSAAVTHAGSAAAGSTPDGHAAADSSPGAGAGEAITVPMSSAAYRFAAGHRLRLQVSAGAHPRFARNTGTGEPVATATRLVPVDLLVRHGGDVPAALSLPVMLPSSTPGD